MPNFMSRSCPLLIAAVLLPLACCAQTTTTAPQTFSAAAPPRASSVIIGFEWMGEQSAYPTPGAADDVKVETPIPPRGNVGYTVRFGDTFPMTWADDDEIYASAGDPNWGEKWDGLDVEKFSGTPPHYTITRVNAMPEYVGSGGGGPKPTGMISVNGVLYLAIQNLLGRKPPAHGTRSQHGDDAIIVSSRDHGKTWSPPRNGIATPMFAGNYFGGPAFVNNGKDNANAPDKYVYAISTDQWDNGSNLRVGRVLADRIQDASAWEWIARLNNYARPHWTHDLQHAIPVLTEERRISLPDMVYVASIRRYLLLTWNLHKDFSSHDGTDLAIYDAPHPWGPFTLVHNETLWEGQAMNPYCPRLPLKWVKLEGNQLVGWIQFSGSWSKDSVEYRSHVREFRMKLAQR